MGRQIKFLGHPVHPILIVFPLGLLTTAVVFDLLYLVFRVEVFPQIAYWMIAAGIVGGALAALVGAVDWLGLPGGTRAKSVGLIHGLGNAGVLILFGISLWLRSSQPAAAPGLWALLLAFLGAGLSAFTGWLGGELVYRMGVSVDPGANLDAPSSLSDQPADQKRRS
ncbi:MAG TPA: DUF2231 domain-containing protein [Anaerolineales bacterium]|nr:DUF2231 domain-containing protein [Anaerolineales bacterium]